MIVVLQQLGLHNISEIYRHRYINMRDDDVCDRRIAKDGKN